MVNIFIIETDFGTTTDEDGYYTLIIPDSLKRVQIRYSMMGYKEELREIFFKKKDFLCVNVSMRMEPLKAQGIVVSAKKRKFKSTAFITPPFLSDEEFISLPSLIEGDLLRTIEVLPGVTKASDFLGSFSVRGGSPEQNLILIDNIPILSPFHLFGIVSAFNATAIKSAELYSSGIPVRYDASLSSVLAIKTKGVDREIEGFTGIASLSLLSGGLTLGDRISSINSNFLVSFRRTYADKVLALFNYELPYYFYDVYFHWETDIKDWTLVFSGYRGADFLDLREKDEESIKIVGFDWKNNVLALNLFHSGAEGDLLHIFTGYSNYDFSLRVLDNTYLIDGNVDVWSLGGEYTRNLKDHEITFGVSNLYWPFEYNARAYLGLKYSYEGIWSDQASIYIEDKIKIAETLLLLGGLSLTQYYSKEKGLNTENLEFLRAYRLSLKYFLKELEAITFSYGNFHQYIVAVNSPEMPIYYWVPLGGRYDPEEAHHFNLGWESWIREDLYFSLEGYYRNFNRIFTMKPIKEIDLGNEEDYYQSMFEKGDGKSFGLDLFLKREIGSNRGWISYSFLRSYVNLEGETYLWDWDRTHNFHLTFLTLLRNKYELGIQFAFCTGTPYTTSIARYRCRKDLIPYREVEFYWREIESKRNQVRYPSYTRLDLSLSRSFYIRNNELNIKLNIFNLLNSKNVFLYYYDYKKEPPIKKAFYMLPFIPSIEFIYKF